MKKKAEVTSKKRHSLNRFWSILALVLVIGIAGSIIYSANQTEAKRSAPVDAGEKTFYKEGGTPGVDWQPFEQSYALGYIALGESSQDRHCSPATSSRPNNPENDICKFTNRKKDLNRYIDYPLGASYLGKRYDIREYIWNHTLSKGVCAAIVNIGVVRSWYPGSISSGTGCDSQNAKIREWHFYPAGTLGRDENGNYKTPSEQELAEAEYKVSAGAEHGFRGVMRLDDFDYCSEGYAIPIGNRGVWTVYNTQLKIQSAPWIKGRTIDGTLINYNVYEWCGTNSTTSSNPRTAMWLQFESTARNPADSGDIGAPLTMVYYNWAHRSSISSQLVTLTFKVYGDIPQIMIDAMNNTREEMQERERNSQIGTSDCIDDSDFSCEEDIQEDAGGSGFIIGGDDDVGGPAESYESSTGSTTWTNQTIKSIGITVYGLYSPYDPDTGYYQELIDLLPEGYSFDGWYDRETGQKIPKDADSMIIYNDHEFYGYVTKKTESPTTPYSCYSEI